MKEENLTTEKKYVNRIVNKIIIPRFGGKHHLRGEVTKLRSMNFNKILRWMDRRGVISRNEKVKLIKKYKERVK